MYTSSVLVCFFLISGSQLISTPVALDPSIKLAYAEQEWEPEYFTSGRERLEQVVCLLCLIPN
jgi:hypothetical protein